MWQNARSDHMIPWVPGSGLFLTVASMIHQRDVIVHGSWLIVLVIRLLCVVVRIGVVVV